MENKLAALLGLHIGDSLGATLEFKGPRELDNLHTEIIGGGSFDWEAGEPTDDTQMMLALLESINECNGFDIYDLAERFISWYETDPKDIGNTISEAIGNLINGVSPLKSGVKTEYSQGNGSLMRSAPLCLLPYNEDFINQQAAITHAHPNCALFDRLFIKSINMLSQSIDRNEVYSFNLEALKEYPAFYQDFKSMLDLSWDNLKTSGYVFHTYAAAFWGLMNTESFEDALIKIVNRGDDSDTVGAVAGALCGAYYGIDAIPQRWLNTIKEKNKIIKLFNNITKS